MERFLFQPFGECSLALFSEASSFDCCWQQGMHGHVLVLSPYLLIFVFPSGLFFVQVTLECFV